MSTRWLWNKITKTRHRCDKSGRWREFTDFIAGYSCLLCQQTKLFVNATNSAAHVQLFCFWDRIHVGFYIPAVLKIENASGRVPGIFWAAAKWFFNGNFYAGSFVCKPLRVQASLGTSSVYFKDKSWSIQNLLARDRKLRFVMPMNPELTIYLFSPKKFRRIDSKHICI